MGDTGQVCTVTGIYRSSDCGYEIALSEGDEFPHHCTIHHGHEVTWYFDRPI